MPKSSRSGRFFLVGPLRTGSSLLTRCVDDHPDAICLCESEINRALFRDYFVGYHCQRMNAHGLATDEALSYLDRKRQDDVDSFETWYDQVHPRLTEIHGKPATASLGDKSPDFYQSLELVRHLAERHRLIYTVRDPRAIFASIQHQTDSSEEIKAERWASLIANFHAWEPYLDAPNVLVIRYEDLVSLPALTMRKVHAHLGLANSTRYFEPFPRLFPNRFLWDTAIDCETGVRRDFDPGRISSWTTRLTPLMTWQVESNREVTRFKNRFGYR